MSKEFIPAPSILSADFSKLGAEVEKVMDAGTHWIHVDVMDGHFVPNLTIGAPVVKSLRKIEKAYLDCHLMIEEPDRYIDDFIKAGANNITLHMESQGNMGEMLERIRKAGVHAGITLRPSTPLSEIEAYLPLVDLVLVMTVNPGFGGQSFMEDQVPKVKQLDQWRRDKGYSYKIQVDGGISDTTKLQVTEADVLVAGSFVFKHPEGLATAIKKLKDKK